MTRRYYPRFRPSPETLQKQEEESLQGCTLCRTNWRR